MTDADAPLEAPLGQEREQTLDALSQDAEVGVKWREARDIASDGIEIGLLLKGLKFGTKSERARTEYRFPRFDETWISVHGHQSAKLQCHTFEDHVRNIMRIPARHLLDYDSVAVVVLMIAMSILELFVLGY